MASMSVSLSDQMRGFIKSRVDSGDYHNESEYIRDLVRRDREKLDKENQLLSLLKQSEESGTSNRDLPQIMADVEERLRKNGKL